MGLSFRRTSVFGVAECVEDSGGVPRDDLAADVRVGGLGDHRVPRRSLTSRAGSSSVSSVATVPRQGIRGEPVTQALTVTEGSPIATHVGSLSTSQSVSGIGRVAMAVLPWLMVSP